MSETNNDTKILWGQRELKIRDLLLITGFAGFLLVVSGGLMAYAYLN